LIAAALLLQVALWASPVRAQEQAAEAPAEPQRSKRRRRPRRPPPSVPADPPPPPVAEVAPAQPAIDCGATGELCESPSGDQAVAVDHPETSEPEADAERRRQQAEFDRLFGPTPGPLQVDALAPDRLPDFPLWMAPLVVLAGVGLYLLRGRLSKIVSAKVPIQVVGRAPLGPGSSVVILEVVDGDGGTRRLLVGMTGSASPNLLADLSATPALPDLPAEPPSPSRSFSVEVGDDPPSQPPVARPRTPVEPIRGGWDRALREAEEPAAGLGNPRSAPSPRLRRLPAGLEDRDDLIAEVLAERGENDENPAARRKGGGYTPRGGLG